MDMITLSLEMLEDSSRAKPSHSKNTKLAGRLIKIKVKTMTKAEEEVEILDSSSIDELRVLAAAKFPGTLRRPRLIGMLTDFHFSFLSLPAAGKELKDGQTIAEYGIVDGSTVHLVASTPATASSSAEDPAISESSPSLILSSAQNFDLFFRFLSLPAPLGLRFWELIERLPTSSAFRDAISQLKVRHVSFPGDAYAS